MYAIHIKIMIRQVIEELIGIQQDIKKKYIGDMCQFDDSMGPNVF